MDVLGVRVDNLTCEEILEKVALFLCEPKFHQIATVNPEFILTAQKDEGFRKILNESDLNIVDGFGLHLAFWRKGERIKGRMAGADLLEEILKIAQAHNFSVFAACKRVGISTSEEVKNALKARFEALEMGGADFELESDQIPNISQYNIVFVNFGAPEQEKFIYSLKTQENGKIRLAIGVGGSFDFLTGKIKRAPKWMRSIGFEWLYRFWQQPNRWRRIWNAVIVFPIKVLFSK